MGSEQQSNDGRVTDEELAAGPEAQWPQAGDDDIRHYMFRQPEDGRLTGVVEWNRAAAIGYALRLGLILVERRWRYMGEQVVSWTPEADDAYAHTERAE